jgi:hypothetical protein
LHTNKNVCFPKTENRKVKQVLSGGWHQWEGEDVRKGCRRVNMVEYYVLMYEKWKNETY